MGGKTTILAGLLAGVLVGGGALAAAVVYAPGLTTVAVLTPSPAPEPAATPTTAPSSTPVAASPSPTAAASPSASASTGPAASPSAGPSTPSATAGASLFGVGKAAPALALSGLRGGSVSLASLAGKPVWVNFMATWCPSCRDELPVMAGLATRYASAGLTVLLVDVSEDQSTVSAYLASLGITFPVGLDTTGLVAQSWRATALPVHFWVDRGGVVQYGALGSIGPDVMVAGLKSILPGVNVTP